MLTHSSLSIEDQQECRKAPRTEWRRYEDEMEMDAILEGFDQFALSEFWILASWTEQTASHGSEEYNKASTHSTHVLLTSHKLQASPIMPVSSLYPKIELEEKSIFNFIFGRQKLPFPRSNGTQSTPKHVPANVPQSSIKTLKIHPGNTPSTMSNVSQLNSAPDYESNSTSNPKMSSPSSHPTTLTSQS